jgi:hypothetical protein
MTGKHCVHRSTYIWNQLISMLQPNQTRGLLPYLLGAWLLAGTLDISSALIWVAIRSGKSPVPVFNYIASAIFGKDAYTGGMPMIIAGFLFHYFIALVFSLLLFLSYPGIHRFIKNKFLVGILFGLFNWAVMTLAVVPLTRIPARPFNLSNALINIGILMLAIGIPVSLIAHHYYYGRAKNNEAVLKVLKALRIYLHLLRSIQTPEDNRAENKNYITR